MLSQINCVPLVFFVMATQHHLPDRGQNCYWLLTSHIQTSVVNLVRFTLTSNLILDIDRLIGNLTRYVNSSIVNLLVQLAALH